MATNVERNLTLPKSPNLIRALKKFLSLVWKNGHWKLSFISNLFTSTWYFHSKSIIWHTDITVYRGVDYNPLDDPGYKHNGYQKFSFLSNLFISAPTFRILTYGQNGMGSILLFGGISWPFIRFLVREQWLPTVLLYLKNLYRKHSFTQSRNTDIQTEWSTKKITII